VSPSRSNRVLKKEPQQMVVLRFFRSSGKRIKPDGTILGKLEKNLLLKKTQWHPSFRIKWSHKGNFLEIKTTRML
jgi:hypothetical protein